ncbi:DNA-(apurinic or apyrimidinic site) lyase 2 [Colletotrichum spaethianum]|uniref:DNA-(apurinic or apyrimidinic site) endonuclease 2 n=1 Tax=Colletotrichum spaethianum TaxID=700344 RepID=A0AA37LCD1_9PEZI|nr:DNA-(apurinic or apyrimidinic site) lyase 2 [Colletotrichum spaethianum]GKT46046.1 DNA-(apurinic or apyrimidinic site) lyase 2 [Colletotrichum spaethianum]
MFEILEADIVIIQETKIQRKDLRDDMVLVPGWDVFFSLPKHKKGYSGVAIYTRNATCCPIRAEEGITGILTGPNSTTSFRDLPEAQQIGGYPRPDQLLGEVDEATLDSEGRCVVLEFPAFVLIGTYSPATRDSSRNDFRLGYLNALDARVRNLVAAGKQVILTGDLNVIRDEMDTCNVREALRKEGMSVEEWMGMPSRRLFNHLVFDGQVTGERDEGRETPVLYDLTRIFHPTRLGMFTCWDTKRNTRPANNGSRIDYILCSAGIKDWFTDSNIQEGLMGSDHCPVYANMADTVKANGKDTSVLDLMNPDGMFRDGKRLREWSAKDLLPLSAKLIPEFDRRRNIRDMFMKKPAAKPSPNPALSAVELQSLVSEEPPTPQEKENPEPSQQEASEPPASQASVQSNPVKPSLAPSTTRPPASQTKSPVKRVSETTMSTKRPAKKTKTTDTDSSSKQSTLTGFFKPKQPPPKPIPTEADPTRPNQLSPTNNRGAAGSGGGLSRPSLSGISKTPPPPSVGAVAADAPPPPAPSPSLSATNSVAAFAVASALDTSEKVFDPIEVKESWSRFNLGKRVVPKCEHGEPCIILQTKKPGVNCGRSFYICPRPLGKSGEKEKGTEWRCGTFIWSSDWKKDQS